MINTVREEDCDLCVPRSTQPGAQHVDSNVQQAGTMTWLWTPAKPRYQFLRLCLVSVGSTLGRIRETSTLGAEEVVCGARQVTHSPLLA